MILAQLRDKTGTFESLINWQNKYRAEKRRLKEERRLARQAAEERRRLEAEAAERLKQEVEHDRKQSVISAMSEASEAADRKEAARKVQEAREEVERKKHEPKIPPALAAKIKLYLAGLRDKSGVSERIVIWQANYREHEHDRRRRERRIITTFWVRAKMRMMAMADYALRSWADKFFESRRTWTYVWHRLQIWATSAKKAADAQEELDRAKRAVIELAVLALKAELELQDKLELEREAEHQEWVKWEKEEAARVSVTVLLSLSLSLSLSL